MKIRLSQVLREQRICLGLGTHDMADKCGVSYHTYLRLERQNSESVTLKTIITIATALHLSLDSLILGKGSF